MYNCSPHYVGFKSNSSPKTVVALHRPAGVLAYGLEPGLATLLQAALEPGGVEGSVWQEGEYHQGACEQSPDHDFEAALRAFPSMLGTLRPSAEAWHS